MAHLLAGDDRYRDLIGDDRRSRLVERTNSLGDYRFGRLPRKPVRGHAHAALNRVGHYVKNMIEAIAESKLRRMARELELRGIHCDRPSDRHF